MKWSGPGWRDRSVLKAITALAEHLSSLLSPLPPHVRQLTTA